VPGLALGVDLGGTNARAAVVDAATGEIVSAHREPLRERSPERVVDVVRGAILRAAAAAGIAPASAGSSAWASPDSASARRASC